AAGIHPKWLVIELLPPLLHQQPGFGEIRWLNINRVGWDDRPVLWKYTDDHWFRARRWLRSRLTPWSSHRFAIMSRVAPGWLPWDSRQDGWRGLDRSGWLPYQSTSVTPEKYADGVRCAHREYAPALFEFRITQLPEMALREILDLCRREQISPMLLLMP